MDTEERIFQIHQTVSEIKGQMTYLTQLPDRVGDLEKKQARSGGFLMGVSFVSSLIGAVTSFVISNLEKVKSLWL
jgi:hypothetical protein